MRDYDLHLAQQTEQLSGGLISTIWTNWQSRRRLVRLLELDDHLLFDIGVDRVELEQAAHLPLWHNGVRRLAALRQHRLERMTLQPAGLPRTYVSGIRPA